MISVVLPTYNRASQIVETIKSVLNQSFTNFELIVVDDGSTDNTQQVIENINDVRLRYIRYEQNKGACYARNIGIKNAKYSIIAFQDSDDMWKPNYLEEQWREFKSNSKKFDAQICRYNFKFDGKERIAPSEKDVAKGVDIHNLFRYNIVSTQILIIKKTALLDINGFDESLPALQDWDLAIRLLKQNHSINILNKVLVDVKVSIDSISRNKQKRIQAINIIYEKNLDYFRNNKNDFYNFSYSVFRAYQLNYSFRIKKWHFFKNCITTKPFCVRNFYLLIYEGIFFLRRFNHLL
jgi:glycosyltransferase involved in cell wall biosynthesis